MKRLLALTFVLALLLPSWALAEGVLSPAANPPDRTLYDYRTSLYLQDDFIKGVGQGLIGTLNWSFGNGVVQQTSGSTNRIGLVTRTTSATINTLAYTVLNNSVMAVLDPAMPHRLVFIQKLNQVDANTVFWSGEANDPTAAVPNDGIYFEKRAADTNWFCITRAASSQTRTDSGVAVTTSYITMLHERTASNVRFSLNGVLVCTHTATIPTEFLNPAWLITNTAAADKTVTTDYFELALTGLVR